MSAGAASAAVEGEDPPPSPAPPATVRVGVFGQSLPEIVAVEKGYFARERLNVQFHQVSGSIQQFKFLRDDLYDLVNTAPDNDINYLLNDSNPLGQRIDNTIINGLDRGWGLGLYAQAKYRTVEDLRGKNLAVDATNSGFAYVLYEIMRKHGLEVGRDYTVTPVGGVFARYKELLAGKTDATLLSAGFDVRARYLGYSEIDKETTVSNPYFGGATAAKPAWLRAHRDVAVRYLRAYFEALLWSVDPANREESVALLQKAKGVPRDLAQLLYDGEVNAPNGDGLIQDSSIDRKALLNVLKLRQRAGGFDRPQDLCRLASPGSGVFDGSYLREAIDGRDDGDDEEIDFDCK
ncbi:MAG: ABC transporter substrate-binding protein [Myxococcales bacterium]